MPSLQMRSPRPNQYFPNVIKFIFLIRYSKYDVQETNFSGGKLVSVLTLRVKSSANTCTDGTTLIVLWPDDSISNPEQAADAKENPKA